MVRHIQILIHSDGFALLIESTLGGPGGGCDTRDRGFFNPEKYKVTRPSFEDYIALNNHH